MHVCIAKITQRAPLPGFGHVPLAMPRDAWLAESQKRVTPRTMDPSMTIPLIVKSGLNYA